MAVTANTTYTIQGNGFSMSFSAPAGLTVAELKTYLSTSPVGIDISDFTDATWDSVVENNRANETNIGSVPIWSTWSPQQAYDHVVSDVFSGSTKAQAEAWIDTNVTNLAQAKISLKMIADAIIDLRDMTAFIAKILMYLVKRPANPTFK